MGVNLHEKKVRKLLGKHQHFELRVRNPKEAAGPGCSLGSDGCVNVWSCPEDPYPGVSFCSLSKITQGIHGFVPEFPARFYSLLQGLWISFRGHTRQKIPSTPSLPTAIPSLQTWFKSGMMALKLWGFPRPPRLRWAGDVGCPWEWVQTAARILMEIAVPGWNFSSSSKPALEVWGILSK